MSIKIEQLLPLLKKGWVAMDEDGEWNWWAYEPKIRHESYWWVLTREQCCLSDCFNIAPAKDWTKSLMRCGNE